MATLVSRKERGEARKAYQAQMDGRQDFLGAGRGINPAHSL